MVCPGGGCARQSPGDRHLFEEHGNRQEVTSYTPSGTDIGWHPTKRVVCILLECILVINISALFVTIDV